LLPFVAAGKSNHDRFLEMVGELTRDSRERVDATAAESATLKNDRQGFRSFVRSILTSLPEQEQNAHRFRLDSLETQYDLSYGAIIEAITSVQSQLKRRPHLPGPGILETSFRATFMDHGNSLTIEPAPVEVNELTADTLAALLDRTFEDATGVGPDRARFLMLMSGVLMGDGSSRFIPMLDFRLSPDPFHCDVVEALVRAADVVPGAIVESGLSYHYYGFRLMKDHELLQFAHKALLMVPFVDARYLGHRLLGGELRLRISGRSRTDPAPRVSRVLV
jgi:hypothetical protein